MSDLLSIQDVIALEAILSAAQGTRPVRRLADDGSILGGIARSIGDENGNHAPDLDVRDRFLRVTGPLAEHYWPVRDLMRQASAGEFAVD